MYLPSLKKCSDKELSVLKPSEQKIVDALEHNQQMNLKEISDLLQIKYPHIYIKNLLNLGWIQDYESHQEKYRVKTIQKINLHSSLKKDERLLEDAFNKLSKAPKQEELLLKFLQLNQDLSGKSVIKKKLLSDSNLSRKYKYEFFYDNLNYLLEFDLKMAQYSFKHFFSLSKHLPLLVTVPWRLLEFLLN